MKTFAYCCESFLESARRAAGVQPVTCPPTHAGTFRLEWLEGGGSHKGGGGSHKGGPYRMLYFDLHGEPGDAAWYGDERTVALTADQVREADLTGAVIFAVNCYLADRGSPMMDALLDAGARYVIGGEGKNWANTRRPTGAAALGRRFRQLMARGLDPLVALTLAKRWVALGLAFRRVMGGHKSSKTLAVKDALAFRAYHRV